MNPQFTLRSPYWLRNKKKDNNFRIYSFFFHLELTIGHPYKHIYLTYDSFQTLSLNYMHKAKSFVQKEKTKSDFYLKTPNNWLLCITWSWSFSEPGNSCAILPQYILFSCPTVQYMYARLLYIFRYVVYVSVDNLPIILKGQTANGEYLFI